MTPQSRINRKSNETSKVWADDLHSGCRCGYSTEELMNLTPIDGDNLKTLRLDVLGTKIDQSLLTEQEVSTHLTIISSSLKHNTFFNTYMAVINKAYLAVIKHIPTFKEYSRNKYVSRVYTHVYSVEHTDSFTLQPQW